MPGPISTRLAPVLLLPFALSPVPAPAGSAPQGDAHSEQQVSYSSEDIALAATLLLPAGEGPFPGAVIVHGSGESDRSNPWTAAYAAALVERGVAVLHPDKRGSGASGGDWTTATFDELASDALAAHALLCAHQKVDRARVGLLGFSQGGHVVPLAAARERTVAFAIDVSGSVVPMLEQIADETLLAAEEDGLGEDKLEILRELQDLAARYVRDGEGWSAYAETLAEAREGPLGGARVLAGFPDEADAAIWDYLRLIGSFDPLPHWRALEVPALFVFGGRDRNVDVYKSVDLIEDALTDSGLSYSLLLFRNNGHALFREDAMDFMARWIRDRGAD